MLITLTVFWCVLLGWKTRRMAAKIADYPQQELYKTDPAPSLVSRTPFSAVW